MTVQAILNRKGSAVHTVQTAATIADAAMLLSRHEIGALVATDRRGLTVGIISERDIVRALSGLGRAALDTPVSAVMTRGVLSCNRQDSVDDVMRRMSEGRLRHLPVIEEGQLIGIVSIRDAVALRLEEMIEDSHALFEYANAKLRDRQSALQRQASLGQSSFPKIF